MRHLFPFPSFHLCAFYERRADQARTADPATAQSHGHDAGRTGLTDGRFTSVRCQMGDGPVITGHRPSGPVAGRTPNEPRRAHHPRRQGILPGPRPSCEGSPTSCPAERTAHSRPLPFILGILLCCCGLGGLGVVGAFPRASGPSCGLERLPAYRPGRLYDGHRPLARPAAGLLPARLRQPHAALPVAHRQENRLIRDRPSSALYGTAPRLTMKEASSIKGHRASRSLQQVFASPVMTVPPPVADNAHPGDQGTGDVPFLRSPFRKKNAHRPPCSTVPPAFSSPQTRPGISSFLFRACQGPNRPKPIKKTPSRSERQGGLEESLAAAYFPT